jgi:outer membrane protein assembly factor BamB
MTCPIWQGGKDWEAGAYSPETNLMYMPLRHTCGRVMASDNGTWYDLTVRTEITPGETMLGTIQAISAETGETVWTHSQEAFTMSLVATGGGLVFGGDSNGRFKALDHETGEVLWEINIGSPVTRLSGDLCRRWAAVCCGEHRLLAQHQCPRSAQP